MLAELAGEIVDLIAVTTVRRCGPSVETMLCRHARAPRARVTTLPTKEPSASGPGAGELITRCGSGGCRYGKSRHGQVNTHPLHAAQIVLSVPGSGTLKAGDVEVDPCCAGIFLALKPEQCRYDRQEPVFVHLRVSSTSSVAFALELIGPRAVAELAHDE
jgi:hypothetical protein